MQLENTENLNLGAGMVACLRIIVDLEQVGKDRMYRPRHQVSHRHNKVLIKFLFKAAQLLVHIRVLHANDLQLGVFEVKHQMTLTKVLIDFSC